MNPVPYKSQPNSYQYGYEPHNNLMERWYGADGLPELDRHHTDHSNPKEHPWVPHDHDWHDNGKGGKKPGRAYQSPPNVKRGERGKKDNSLRKTVAVFGGAYVAYQVVKWRIALGTAIPTGGISVGSALLIP